MLRPTGKGAYQASVTVPRIVNGVLLPAGSHRVALACVTGKADCVAHPEAGTFFHLTASPSVQTVDWASLKLGRTRSLAKLSRINHSHAVDPADPARKAVCQGGQLGGGAVANAYLAVSGPHPWRAILSPSVFGDAHGYIGCRALALDPNHPQVLYAAGLDDMGGQGPLAIPPAVYTTNGGQTWQGVPTPPGFPTSDTGGEDFIGFAVDARGVTAWFSRIVPGLPEPPKAVLGERTTDGGHTWRTVSPACPPSGPCAWRIPPLPYSTPNMSAFAPYLLLLSPSGGTRWQPAVFAGYLLWGGHAYLDPRGDILLSGAGCDPFVGNAPSCPSFLPLLLSRNGGNTWSWVTLPPPPGGWQEIARNNLYPPVGYGGLLMTKQGALAMAVKSWNQPPWFSWMVLDPGSSTWVLRRGGPPGLLP